jgi:hypothetical protein
LTSSPEPTLSLPSWPPASPTGNALPEGLSLPCTQESAETAGLSLTLNLWELLEVTTVAMR